MNRLLDQMYKASMDNTTKVMTTFVILLLAGVELIPVKRLLSSDITFGEAISHTLVLLLLMAMLVGTWMFAPSHYEIDARHLVIHRNVGQVMIPLGEIAEIKRQDGVLGRSFRTFGVGGLFGYYGKFYTDGVGAATFYATQRKNWVWVKLKSGKNILLTPDRPEEFAGRLRGMVSSLREV